MSLLSETPRVYGTWQRASRSILPPAGYCAEVRHKSWEELGTETLLRQSEVQLILNIPQGEGRVNLVSCPRHHRPSFEI